MRTIRRHTPPSFHPKHPVDAVYRINRRWIVHGGLRESTAAYLDELAENDPPRLRRSCELAMDLVHSGSVDGDPKPWFYGGIFALATADEAARFLADHPLTRTTWNRLNDRPACEEAPESVVALAGKISDSIERLMVLG